MKMNHLKRRSLCKKCRVCFVRDNDTQVYCHACLSESLSLSKRFLKEVEKRQKKCFICSTWFFPINGRSTCGDECKKELILENKKRYAEKKREKEALKEGLTLEAKRWLSLKRSSESIFSLVLRLEEECGVMK